MKHAYRLIALCALASTSLSVRAAEPLVAEAIVNAPVAVVWEGFTTPAGYAAAGVAQARVDLVLGGTLEVSQASPDTAESQTTVSEIIAFEPEKLLATRVRQPPTGLGNPAAYAGTWSIVYFTPLGPDMTHVRVAGFLYREAGLEQFFEQDHAAQLKRLEKMHWPLCELCKVEQN